MASNFLPPKNTRLCTAQLTTDLFNQTAMLLKKVQMKIFSTKGSANQQKNYRTMLFMSFETSHQPKIILILQKMKIDPNND